MGASRFESLKCLLREDVSILGLDEHTACIIDLSHERVSVVGIGSVTLQSRGRESTYDSGSSFSLSAFSEGRADLSKKATLGPAIAEAETENEGSYWKEIHAFQEAFKEGLERQQYHKSTNALLGIDQAVWKASQDLEHDEFISQGREILRELIVLLGNEIEALPKSREACLNGIVETLLEAREQCRQSRRWSEADAIRAWLQEAGIAVEDTQSGSVWRLLEPGD
jgi:cysteinyl-tRNA synthetase